MVELNSVPIPMPEVAGRLIEGEAVIVLPRQGEVKVLNEVGARIWSLADGRRTVEEIAGAISLEYQVTPAEAQEDTCRFIALLCARGVLTLQPPAADKG